MGPSCLSLISRLFGADWFASSAFFNNITYKAPSVPTLYTVMTSGNLAINAEVYGTYSHSFVLGRDQVIEIVVNNLDTGRHPFHLHGHHFQSVYRSGQNAGTFAQMNITEAGLHQTPMRRDTLIVFPGGNIVLRFKADNPGKTTPYSRRSFFCVFSL